MGCKPRPIPADFAEVMGDKPRVEDLMKRYSAGDSTIRRWLKEIGYEHERLRPMPADFIHIAASMAKFELKNHYRASQKTIDRWLKETGVKTRGAIKPPPEDFAEMAAEMCAAELRRHYNAGGDRIARWCKVVGVTPKPYDFAAGAAKASEASRASVARRFFSSAGSSYRPIYDQRVGTRTIYDDAADTLRRYGPCYRCNERGAGDHKGKFWRFGNVVCTDEELLARAARYERKAA